MTSTCAISVALPSMSFTLLIPNSDTRACPCHRAFKVEFRELQFASRKFDGTPNGQRAGVPGVRCFVIAANEIVGPFVIPDNPQVANLRQKAKLYRMKLPFEKYCKRAGNLLVG